MDFKQWQLTEDSRQVTGRIRGEEASRMRVALDVDIVHGDPSKIAGGD